LESSSSKLDLLFFHVSVSFSHPGIEIYEWAL
jgi:hypothetical protein